MSICRNERTTCGYNRPSDESHGSSTVFLAIPVLVIGVGLALMSSGDLALGAKGGKGKGGGPPSNGMFQMDMAESGGHFFWSTAEIGSVPPITSASDEGILRFNGDMGANNNGHIHLREILDKLDPSGPDLSACFDLDGDGMVDNDVKNRTTHILLDDTVPGGVVVRLTFWALDLNGRELKYRVFLSGFTALDENGNEALWDPLGLSDPNSKIEVGQVWELRMTVDPDTLIGNGSISVFTIDDKKFHRPCSAGPFFNDHEISVFVQRVE